MMNHITFYTINAWIEELKHQEPMRDELALEPLDMGSRHDFEVVCLADLTEYRP